MITRLNHMLFRKLPGPSYQPSLEMVAGNFVESKGRHDIDHNSLICMVHSKPEVGATPPCCFCLKPYLLTQANCYL